MLSILKVDCVIFGCYRYINFTGFPVSPGIPISPLSPDVPCKKISFKKINNVTCFPFPLHLSTAVFIKCMLNAFVNYE